VGVCDIGKAKTIGTPILSITYSGTADAVLTAVQIYRIATAYRWVEVGRLAWRRRRSVIIHGASPILLAVFILFATVAQAQTTAALYVTSPANNARVDGRFVSIQFQLSAGVSANGIPEFLVQLDGQTPVLISDTEYPLYWLSPGWHTVTVTLVDANGTPIFGAQNQVQFEVGGESKTSELRTPSRSRVHGTGRNAQVQVGFRINFAPYS